MHKEVEGERKNRQFNDLKFLNFLAIKLSPNFQTTIHRVISNAPIAGNLTNATTEASIRNSIRDFKCLEVDEMERRYYF